jgi:hypothetical protein
VRVPRLHPRPVSRVDPLAPAANPALGADLPQHPTPPSCRTTCSTALLSHTSAGPWPTGAHFLLPLAPPLSSRCFQAHYAHHRIHVCPQACRSIELLGLAPHAHAVPSCSIPPAMYVRSVWNCGCHCAQIECALQSSTQTDLSPYMLPRPPPVETAAQCPGRQGVQATSCWTARNHDKAIYPQVPLWLANHMMCHTLTAADRPIHCKSLSLLSAHGRQ